MSSTVPYGPQQLVWLDSRQSERIVSNVDTDFERAFALHYERLVNSLTAITGDRELARDCVQEAFVKASTRWRRVRRYDDPLAWIRRVAINRSRDHLRSVERRRRRERRVFDMSANDVETGDSDAVDAALRLDKLLSTLSSRQRAAATLYYLDDMAVNDIAGTIGISSGAVKYHLNQARAALRTVVEQERGVRD